MTNTKKLDDMTKTEKLAHLKGNWTLTGLERQIAKCEFSRSSESTNYVLEQFFVHGKDQVDIARMADISRQGVSNTLTRFIIRLYGK